MSEQKQSLSYKDAGVDIDAKDRWGSTALHEAIKNKHKSIVEYLRNH